LIDVLARRGRAYINRLCLARDLRSHATSIYVPTLELL